MKIFDIPLPFYAEAGEGGGEGGADKQPDPNADQAKTGDDGDVGDTGDKDKGSTFLDNADDAGGDADRKVVAPADWPDDWRTKMSGEDKDAAKLLERYKSPVDVAKALSEQRKKIGAGKTASDEPMPDAEKEPEKAKEWRQARGIPDDPTGYEVPDTIKTLVTDDDKPRLAEFTEHMYKANVPKAAAQAAMEFYFKMDADAREAVATADRSDQADVEDLLRAEWGSEFRSNSTLAKRFAEQTVPGIFNARLPDGRMVGNVPEFVKAFADLGMREYGDVAFAGSDNSNKTIARKQELEDMMANDPDRYFGDRKYSQEYEKIMEAEEKRNGKR
jgi:hypothetical protein